MMAFATWQANTATTSAKDCTAAGDEASAHPFVGGGGGEVVRSDQDAQVGERARALQDILRTAHNGKAKSQFLSAVSKSQRTRSQEGPTRD